MSTEFTTRSGKVIGVQCGRALGTLAFSWDVRPDELAHDFKTGKIRVVLDEYGRKYSRTEFARHLRKHTHEKCYDRKLGDPVPAMPTSSLVNFRKWDDGGEPPAL